MAMTSAALLPYDGPFGKTQAAHLLRRTTFAVTPERVAVAARIGLAGSLDRLFAPDAPVPPPVRHTDAEDPNVRYGETWVTAPAVTGLSVNNYRQISVRNWMVGNFYEGGFSLERRMLLFFVNHFGVERSGDMRIVYRFYETLRRGMFGTLPELVKKVSVEPLMLLFLNGKDNRASSPNENYARELLELFTIGKGPLVGPGDYSNYTEDDVRALARALTGWQVLDQLRTDPALQPRSAFSKRHHDTTTKVMSARFGGASIANGDEDEYAAVVDLIFAQERAGDYFCRKLYRWFVYHRIDDAVERDVIEPLSAAFRESGYRIEVPIRLLLNSAHFYEERFRGGLVKSPLDEVLDLTAALGLALPEDPDHRYWLLQRINNTCEAQEMALTAPPSVAGFKAYHQAPGYNRFWINASTLQYRTQAARSGIFSGYRRNANTVFQVDVLALIAGFENPSDPNDLVRELTDVMLPVALADTQLAALKEVLIPGLPDFEWTVEYGKHLDRPGDDKLRRAVLNRLHELVFAIASSAEFRLY